MKKTFAIVLAIFFVLQAGTIGAIASESTKEFYQISSEKLIFPNGYMAYFEEVNDIGEHIDTSNYVSGVYNNWEPRKLIYKIDYSFADVFNQKNYYFSSTGTNHVEFYIGFFGEIETTKENPVMTFYKLGKAYKQYALLDLIKEKNALEYTVSNGILWLDTFNYDFVNDALHIKTLDNQYISFDIFTGNIIYQSYDDPFGEIRIGSPVVITGDNYYHPNGSYQYGKQIPVWVKCEPQVVTQIYDDHVLLGEENGINSWVPKNALIGYTKMR